MANDSSAGSDRAPRRERASTTIRLPRVLVIGRETPGRTEMMELFQARGIKALAIDSGIGSDQLITAESLNTVIISDAMDAMSPEAVIKLLRGNPRTREVGIIAIIDPRAEALDGADRSVTRAEAQAGLTDTVIDVFDARNPAPIAR